MAPPSVFIVLAVLARACAQPLPAALEQLRSLSTLGKPKGDAPKAKAVPWGDPWQGGAVSGSGHRETGEAPTAKQEIAARSAQVAAQAVPVASCRAMPVTDAAVVTLISSNEGYPAGALAIAASLEVLGSQLRRVALVTPSVNGGIRDLLRSGSWEVRPVEDIHCNQVLGAGVTSERYDLGEEYQKKKAKWLSTCTKFHAWALVEFRKLIFLDADTLVLRPIDDLLDHPSAFAAAPDTFPADQFNSGVMVIEPSRLLFDALLAWNRVNGTAEGGDQCLLNDFFGEWFYNAWDAPDAGRLPWIMNVAASSLHTYKTLCRMQSRDEPSIAHFVGGQGKPWMFMVLKFQGLEDKLPAGVRRVAHAWDQMYWLAKTNKVCAGTLTTEEVHGARAVLDDV